MGRSVRVTADDGHTWKRKTLLWSDYVDNTIVLSVHGKVSYAKISSILCQGIYLLLRDRILDWLILIVCWSIVVRHTENLVRTEHLESACPHTGESLR
jgi:hypothetical protein